MNVGTGQGRGGPNHGGNWDIDTMGVDTGQIIKSDKELESKGQALPTWAPSVRKDNAPGPEMYTEIKAPTTVGRRSSVPYTKVLPSYRKKAESAIDRQEIPKKYEKRVKEYFESLGGR